MRWTTLILLATSMAGCGPLPGLSGLGFGNTCDSSVLGSTDAFDDECDNNAAFAECCTSHGGTPAGSCYGATTHCSDEARRCFAPPPAATADQHVCEGVLTCNLSQACVQPFISMDQCSYPRCAEFPSQCATTRTCQCLVDNFLISQGHCSEDARGVVTVQDERRGWQ